MTRNEITEKVQVLFREVLDNETLFITYETQASDIPEWDSLTHIQLIVRIENFFGIRFTAKEIGAYKNVGEMCDGIFLKLNPAG